MTNTKIDVSLEWPLAPYAVADAETPVELECVAHRSDGKLIQGKLQGFYLDNGLLDILQPHASLPTSVSFSNLKHLQLTQPITLKSGTTVVNELEGIYAAPELREFQLSFSDGDQLSGNTFGMLETAQGIYLYIEQGNQQYLRTFVPTESMQHFFLGDPIGKLLMDKHSVSEEAISAGLDQQKKLRSQPLGEYLKNEAIVSPEQLEEALRNMRARPSLKIGEILLEAGMIEETQLETALAQQGKDRKRALGDILVDMGVVDRLTVNALLARKMGIPYVSLNRFHIAPEAIKLVPESLARKFNLIPLSVVDKKLFVAMENPLQNEALNEIRFHAKKNVEPLLASAQEIQEAIRSNYTTADFSELASELAVALESDRDEPEAEINESDTVLTRLVNKAILDAHQRGASDIHIENNPGRKGSSIRFRRDGQLVHYLDLPATFRNAIVSRIKVMANLDISERRRGQDGKIDFSHFGPARIELRVATIPTHNGQEDVVLRLLNTGKPRLLKQINLSEGNLAHIHAMANRPHGILLVSGPTGSGKTTTLHSILGHINTADRKIWTAEDPIEITQDGLRQVQVNTKIGWTFANAMRAFLRADPDVIMVGEMRDRETSQIAIEASLTGHLVLSTLHTNSAAESVVRLLELGMDPYNFSDALLGVLAQRLTRALCPACKAAYSADDETVEMLLGEYCEAYEQLGYPPPDRQALLQDWRQRYAQNGKFTLYAAKGCDECEQSGYRGRIGIHELLVNSHKIKHLIQLRSPVSKMQEAAFDAGMRTLKQDGIEKVLMGLTDIEAVRAAC